MDSQIKAGTIEYGGNALLLHTVLAALVGASASSLHDYRRRGHLQPESDFFKIQSQQVWGDSTWRICYTLQGVQKICDHFRCSELFAEIGRCLLRDAAKGGALVLSQGTAIAAPRHLYEEIEPPIYPTYRLARNTAGHLLPVDDSLTTPAPVQTPDCQPVARVTAHAATPGNIINQGDGVVAVSYHYHGSNQTTVPANRPRWHSAAVIGACCLVIASVVVPVAAIALMSRSPHSPQSTSVRGWQ